jgi:hypothetical protein
MTAPGGLVAMRGHVGCDSNRMRTCARRASLAERVLLALAHCTADARVRNACFVPARAGLREQERL